MSKNQTVTKQSYLFSMKNLSTNCFYSSVQVDFTAPLNVCQPSKSIVPIFLKDKNSFTPSFVLPTDQIYYSQNSTYQKTKFQERVLKAHQLHQELQKDKKENQNISLAIPSSSYCQICRSGFSCYQEHIGSDDHLQKIKLNLANHYIADLCELVKDKQEKKCVPEKNKKIKKQKKKSQVQSLTMKTRRGKQKITGISSKVINLSITPSSIANTY